MILICEAAVPLQDSGGVWIQAVQLFQDGHLIYLLQRKTAKLADLDGLHLTSFNTEAFGHRTKCSLLEQLHHLVVLRKESSFSDVELFYKCEAVIHTATIYTVQWLAVHQQAIVQYIYIYVCFLLALQMCVLL